MNPARPTPFMVRASGSLWALFLLTACTSLERERSRPAPDDPSSSSTEASTDTLEVLPTTTYDPSSTPTSTTYDTGTLQTDPTTTIDECVFEACGGDLTGLWLGAYECGRGIVDYDYATSKSSTVAPYGDYFGLEKVCSGVVLDRNVDIELWYLFEDGTLYTSFTYDVDTQAHYPLGCGDASCDDIVRWYEEFYETICEQPQNQPCVYVSSCESEPDGCACIFNLEYTWNSGVQPYTLEGTSVEIDGTLYEYCVEGDVTRFGDPETLEGLYFIERP